MAVTSLATEAAASSRIVIDPITRIEGHLRIEVEVKDGFVVNAWSSGMLFRGIELILKGRNPEDAWLFTQRLCGVCTYVHGVCSVRSVEDALGITVPDNARLVRNLLMGAQYIHDHIVHFYQLHALDWVDVVSALAADPAETADSGRRDFSRSGAHRLCGGQGASEGIRRHREARTVRRGVLGASRLQALSGGEPAPCGTLPCRSSPAGGDGPHARHIGGQEPPSADPEGGRRHVQG